MVPSLAGRLHQPKLEPPNLEDLLAPERMGRPPHARLLRGVEVDSPTNGRAG